VFEDNFLLFFTSYYILRENFIRVNIIKIIAGLFILAFCSAGFLIAGNNKKDAGSDAASLRKNQVAIMGEFRTASFVKSLLVWEYFMNGSGVEIAKENNSSERERLLFDIVQTKSASLCILGNMVHNGSKKEDWREFDDLIRPLVGIGIDVMPVIGQHEYWGRDNMFFRHAQVRFPLLKNDTWYTKIISGVAFIIIDTNINEMQTESWRRQKQWYNEMMDYYDRNNSVRGVVVLSYHPVTTLSQLDYDLSYMSESFKEKFVSSQKALFFISASGACYEKIEESGKYFLISSGGGSPRRPLKQESLQTTPGYYTVVSDRQNMLGPFNYLILDLAKDGISVRVRGMSKNSTDVNTLEEFFVPFNY